MAQSIMTRSKHIIGWDDDYSADNFTGSDTPSSNGAWLVKNSYGTSAGDNGYFWLSYEQKISSAAVYVAADGKVNRLYGHDTISAKDTIPYNWSAVILRANDDEILSDISFHTRNNNVEYELYINKFGTDEEPVKPGTPENIAASGNIEMAGYHTVTLDEPVEILRGQYFAVILKLSDKSGHEYISAVEDTGMIRSASTITVAGKSYFADVSDGLPEPADWKDGKQLYEEGNVRDASCGASIKIFSSSGETTPITPVTPDVVSTSGGGGGGGCNAGVSAIVLAVGLISVLRRK